MHRVCVYAVNILSLVYCVWLIFTGRLCSEAVRLVWIHGLKIPFVAVKMAKVIGWFGTVAAFFASVIVFYMAALVLGAFGWENWLVPGLVLGPVSLAPVAIYGWTYEGMLSMLGFALGAVPFPLDWPVCWKEAPVAHCVMYVVLGCVGAIIDRTKYVGWLV